MGTATGAEPNGVCTSYCGHRASANRLAPRHRLLPHHLDGRFRPAAEVRQGPVNDDSAAIAVGRCCQATQPDCLEAAVGASERCWAEWPMNAVLRSCGSWLHSRRATARFPITWTGAPDPLRAFDFMPLTGHTQEPFVSLWSEGGCRVSWFTSTCIKNRKSRVTR